MSNQIPTMQELLEAGVHFGHQTKRVDPRMMEYIFGARGGVHIINLEHSEKLLQTACEYVEKLGSEGKSLLFVGTKKQSQNIIKDSANLGGAPYINFRWIPGLLTNFEEVRRNIKKLTTLKEEQEKGQLTRYTKKEQLLISRRLDKFERIWGGVVNMEKLPDVIFVGDAVTEKTAVIEAARMGIPVVGIADSNSNPMMLSYPIPGNDDATKAIKILIEAIGKSYAKGVEKAGKTKPEVKTDEKSEDIKVEDKVSEEVAAVEELVEKKIVEESSREV